MGKLDPFGGMIEYSERRGGVKLALTTNFMKKLVALISTKGKTPEQVSKEAMTAHKKYTRTKEKVKKASKFVIKSRISFFKIDVGSAESLKFFKEMLVCLGYEITFERDHFSNAVNEGIEVLVYHSFNISGSGIYILNTGINSIFFEVESKKDVDEFYKKFLKPRHITIRRNDPAIMEEGMYSLFFDTPEMTTVGIISR